MTKSSQIMEEMDRTRDEIRATIGEISERASVERLAQQYLVPAKTTAVEFGHIFADTVRANPLPLGLTAVGLGWLLLSQRSRPVAALPRNDEVRGLYEPAEPSLKERAGARLDETLRRAGEAVDEGKHRAAETAEDLKQRVGETAEEAKRRLAETAEEAKHRVGETMEKAKASARHFAEDTADRVRGAAGRASHRVRRGVGTAYEFTRDTASDVGGRMRHASRRPVGYAREHPLALGAVLVLGGATLALLIARRGTREEALGSVDDRVAAQSGPVASSDDLHRNPTTPVTPEEEEPVFAAGDLSAEAIRPANEAGEPEREMVATPMMPTSDQSADDRRKEGAGRGSNSSGG
ncbi:MAG: hypothetical protein U1E42_11470 [Rhodospirillales bacterium]